MNPGRQEQIHQIWDDLAEKPASDVVGNIYYLLLRIRELIEAKHAGWIAGLRMEDTEADPTRGWRVVANNVCDPLPDSEEAHNRNMRNMERGATLENTRIMISEAGRFRSYLLSDLIPRDPAKPSAEYRREWLDRGLLDSLFVVAPVTDVAEVYFGFYRMLDQAPFTREELQLTENVLRSLAWFHRQVLLGYGLLVIDAPLTETEQKVLRLLLSDRTERQIAETLGQSQLTTHHHVKNIYRKYGVHSRAGLSALWLNIM